MRYGTVLGTQFIKLLKFPKLFLHSLQFCLPIKVPDGYLVQWYSGTVLLLIISLLQYSRIKLIPWYSIMELSVAARLWLIVELFWWNLFSISVMNTYCSTVIHWDYLSELHLWLRKQFSSALLWRAPFWLIELHSDLFSSICDGWSSSALLWLVELFWTGMRFIGALFLLVDCDWLSSTGIDAEL